MTSWSFLFLSIIVHLVLWYLILHHQPPPDQKKDSVEVTLVDKPKETQPLNFARQTEVSPDQLSAEKKKAKFLSEKDQSVKKEMQSKLSGLTHNASNQKNKSVTKTPVKEQAEKREKLKEDPDGISPRNEKPLSLAQLTPTVDPDQSVNSEELEKVPDGPMTSLDTERFVYYGFYSRIEERIVPIWYRNLHESESRFTPLDLRHMAGRSFTTQVEVILTPQGNWIQTNLLQTSGRPDLDRDALSTFQEGRYFPNPPPALIKDDGNIHLNFNFRYDFSNESPWHRR